MSETKVKSREVNLQASSRWSKNINKSRAEDFIRPLQSAQHFYKATLNTNNNEERTAQQTAYGANSSVSNMGRERANSTYSSTSQHWSSSVTKRPVSVSANPLFKLNTLEQQEKPANSNLANYLMKKYQEQTPIEALSNDRFFKIKDWKHASIDPKVSYVGVNHSMQESVDFMYSF